MSTALAQPIQERRSCTLNTDCRDQETCASYVCVNSTTRYHESYGPGLEWNTNIGFYSVADKSLTGWVISDRDDFRLRLFLVDSTQSQALQLIFSALLTLGCLWAVPTVQRWIGSKLQI